MPGVMPRTRRRGTGGRFAKGGGRSDGRFSLHPENPIPESRMHVTVPVRFGRGRLDSLVTKGLAAYLISKARSNSPAKSRHRAVSTRARIPAGSLIVQGLGKCK